MISEFCNLIHTIKVSLTLTERETNDPQVHYIIKKSKQQIQKEPRWPSNDPYKNITPTRCHVKNMLKCTQFLPSEFSHKQNSHSHNNQLVRMLCDHTIDKSAYRDVWEFTLNRRTSLIILFNLQSSQTKFEKVVLGN